jgi:hypothetical protein
MAANGCGPGLDLGASTRFSPLSPAAATAAAAGQFPTDEETIKKTIGDVTLLVGSDDEGVGNLLITTRCALDPRHANEPVSSPYLMRL